jgi:type VI secretion system protein ImpC
VFSTPLVPLPQTVANPFRRYHTPLFDPRWQRAILTRIASITLPLGVVDMEDVINRIARGEPMQAVPRRPIATVARGLQLLVDQRSSLEPFRADVSELVRGVVRVVGTGGVAVRTFRGLPDWSCSDGLEAANYALPAPGVPVMIVTDLGLVPQQRHDIRATVAEWRWFLARLRRARHRCVVVVPRSEAEIPRTLQGVAQVVPWSRRTLVSRLDESRVDGFESESSSTPTDSNRRASDVLGRLSSAARQLAGAVSLAARVEPQLLRALRLELVPHASVTVEAELWFSDLIDQPAPTGLMIAPGYRESLQRQMRRHLGRLRRAYELIEEHHRQSPPALRLEEELTYKSLIGDSAAVQRLLRQIVATVVTPPRSALAQWASQALVRIPRAIAELEEAQMLAVATAVRTGEIAPLTRGRGYGGTGWSWLHPATRQVGLGITLRRGAIEFVPTSMRASHRIRVPEGNRVLLEITPASAPTEHVRLNPQVRTVLEIAGESFEIAVVGGSRWRLQKARQRRPSVQQRFVSRQRGPRVTIGYEVEVAGAIERRELPFVVGVLADLSGTAAEPLPRIAERKFVEVDADNIDRVMQALHPRLSFRVPNYMTDDGGTQIAVDLSFVSLNDFAPSAIVQQVGPLRERMTPKGANTTEKSAGERLSAQLNAILHNPQFQALEGAWRGLYFLVNNTETSERLKIAVLNVSQRELNRDLQRYDSEEREQSAIYRKVVEEPFGTFGGEPYGCLIGDYHFTHSPADVRLLAAMSKIAADAYSPFIAGASAELMGLESWQRFAALRDVSKVFMTPEYAAWRALRDSEEARFVALAMPRVLARPPYDELDINGVRFTELADGQAEHYTWFNAAYAMAVNITRAFNTYGWCARIRGVESGGAIEGLPVHTFVADDGDVSRSPTEISVTDRRERELASQGLIPLVHRKNSDMAVFFSADTLQKPAGFDDPDATANARLAARLPYVFAGCRFAHYLRALARDKVGTAMSPDQLERYMTTWIEQYVDPAPESSSEAARALRPLAHGEVRLDRSPSTAMLYVRPHYQLEELTVALRFAVPLFPPWPQDRAR